MSGSPRPRGPIRLQEDAAPGRPVGERRSVGPLLPYSLRLSLRFVNQSAALPLRPPLAGVLDDLGPGSSGARPPSGVALRTKAIGANRAASAAAWSRSSNSSSNERPCWWMKRGPGRCRARVFGQGARGRSVVVTGHRRAGCRSTGTAWRAGRRRWPRTAQRRLPATPDASGRRWSARRRPSERCPPSPFGWRCRRS